MKRLYELDYSDSKINLSTKQGTFFMSTNYYQVASGEISVATDTINAAGYQFSGLQALLQEAPEFTYDVIFKDYGNQYIPSINVGINARSNESELSKEFIKVMLSENVQDMDTGSGMPVNQNSFQKRLSIQEEYEIPSDALTLYIKQLSDQDKTEIADQMKQLSIPIHVDGVIMEAVFEELEKYIMGKTEMDEAVNQVVNHLQLYFAE